MTPAHDEGVTHHHPAPEGSPMHGASCDVVGASTPPSPAMPLACVGAWAEVPSPTVQAGLAVASEVRPAGPSPPLFLLHAALLI